MKALCKAETYKDLSALTAACHSVFLIQSIVGCVGCAQDVFSTGSMSFLHTCNLVFPFVGFVNTKESEHANWRVLRWPAVYWLAQCIFSCLSLFGSGRTLVDIVRVLVKLVLTVVQWHGIATLWRLQKASSLKGYSFYLNMIVLNKDDVVKTQVSEKVVNKVNNKLIGGVLGKIANCLVTESKFSRNMADKIAVQFPEMLGESGIIGSAKVEFQYKNFFVVHFSITDVDMQKMAAKKLSEGTASTVTALFSRIPFLQKELEGLAAVVIAEKMMAALPEKLVSKLHDKIGLDVEVETKNPADQAAYFFKVLDTFGNSENQADDEEKSEPASGTSWFPGKRLKQGMEKLRGTRKEKEDGIEELEEDEAEESEQGGWYPGKFIKEGIAKHAENATRITGPLEMENPKAAIPLNETTCQFEWEDMPDMLEQLQTIVDADSLKAIMTAINENVLDAFATKWGTTVGAKVVKKVSTIGIKMALPLPTVVKLGHTVVSGVASKRAKRIDWQETEAALTQFLDQVSALLSGVVLKLGFVGRRRAIVMTWPDEFDEPVSLPPLVPLTELLAVDASETPSAKRERWYPGKYIGRGVQKIKTKIEAHQEKKRELRERRSTENDGTS